MKKVICFLSLLFSSINWLSPARVMNGRHRLYCHRGHPSPPHTVLCNSISHLAWAECDTQKSIPIATPPKCMFNREVCSLTWTDFINRTVEVNQFWIDPSLSALSGWHHTVYTCWLSAPDSAKWIWLNDITLERITTMLGRYPHTHFFSWSLFMPQVSGLEAKRRAVQSAGGEIHTHLLRSHHTHQCKNSYNPTNVYRPVNSSSHWDKSVLIRKWKCKHT